MSAKQHVNIRQQAYVDSGRCRDMHRLIEEGAEPKGGKCAKKRPMRENSKC